MLSNITLTIIKPSAVQENLIPKILNHITNYGFKIKALKITLLAKQDAEQFYLIHKNTHFFNKLIEFMISGPILVSILSKNNAVKSFRELIGNTDPHKAKKGTIRQLYGKSIDNNAIHGSDSNKNAKIESSFFFSTREIFNL